MLHEVVKYVYDELGQKRAVMVATPVDETHVIVGYAMKHPNDIFCKKHGLVLARRRAGVWSDRHVDHVKIPPLLRGKLTEFSARCEAKFGAKNILPWARELGMKG